MSFDFTFQIGEKQESDSFKYHQIHRITENKQKKRLVIPEIEVTLLRPVVAKQNQYNLLVQLSKEDAEQLREFEAYLTKSIQSHLGDATCSLKSEIGEGDQMMVRLPVIRGQITTRIQKYSYGQHRYLAYQDLPLQSPVTMSLRLDSIWATEEYYGSFLYKWKATSIRVSA